MSETVKTEHGTVRFTAATFGNIPGNHVASLDGRWIGSCVFPQSGGSYVWVSSVLSRKGREKTLTAAAVKLAEAATVRRVE
jgi:hypothetical protein